MPRRVRRPSDWNDPDLWGHHLDDQGDRNARLYANGATFSADLSVLTELWLSELNNVRLSSMGAPPNAAAKQPGPRPHEPPLAPDLRPVTTDGGKTVLLRLDGRRTRHGYTGVEVLDEPLSADVAVLAALTALEVSESMEQTLKRLTAILRAEGGGPLGETVHDRVHELLARHEERGRLSDKDARFLEGLDTRPFDFCLVLLRGRRAGPPRHPGRLEMAFYALRLQSILSASLREGLRQETTGPDPPRVAPCRKSTSGVYWGSSGSGGALCGDLRGLAALS
jgi:hypothetical protein